MERPSVSNIVAILEKHAHEFCFSQYTDDSFSPKHHCLLAWMAIEAGIELIPPRYNTHVIGMAGTRRFASELQQAYGLTLQQLKELQFANDEARDVQQMMKMVIELFRRWSESTEIAA